MYLSILILPLLGSIISGFFGRKVGVKGSQLISCACVIATTILASVAFFEVGFNNIPVWVHLCRWIDSESLNVIWGFNFDSLTVSMLIPVLIVSSLVHIYSIGYMSHDPHNQRFFSYLSLFTFMMLILVTANNFLLMFVGWEGVGVCSYLLVSFWFTRIAANQSSLSAFLTNRVGDCFLTIGMFAMLLTFSNIDYSTVFSLAPYISEDIITIIGICLLIGAMAKSSQIGLHVWLPMAMEGPTPVSALIHAATMVTAGVYLLMRSSPLIEYSSTVLLLALWVGAITTVFSSLIGLFQQDIKKVIAYSTMSQLGMMVIAIGLSSYNIALFHLVNHAFYKGLLFLGAGSVIHAVADNQDFRKYGGLRAFLPLTYSVMLIASLSLVAFPFMTGFYSKDFILESAYGQFTYSSTVIYFIATIGAIFTTLYSVKVLYLTFLTNPNGPLANYKSAHEGDIFMSLPLFILALFSIFFGYITKDIYIGLGSGFFIDNSIFIHPNHEILLDTEFAVPTLFKLLPFFFTILFSILAIIFSEFLGKALINFKLSRLGYNIFGFFNQRFLIELFYNTYITDFILNVGGQTTKVIDKGSVELLGPYGLEKGLTNLSSNLSKLDTGIVTYYALYILVGLILYISLPYLYSSFNDLFIIVLLSLITIKTDNHNKKQNYNNKSLNYKINYFKLTPVKRNNLSLIHKKSFSTQSKKAKFTSNKLNPKLSNNFNLPKVLEFVAISLLLFIAIRFPMYTFFNLLGIKSYFPIIAGIYSMLLILVFNIKNGVIRFEAYLYVNIFIISSCLCLGLSYLLPPLYTFILYYLAPSFLYIETVVSLKHISFMDNPLIPSGSGTSSTNTVINVDDFKGAPSTRSFENIKYILDKYSSSWSELTSEQRVYYSQLKDRYNILSRKMQLEPKYQRLVAIYGEAKVKSAHPKGMNRSSIIVNYSQFAKLEENIKLNNNPSNSAAASSSTNYTSGSSSTNTVINPDDFKREFSQMSINDMESIILKYGNIHSWYNLNSEQKDYYNKLKGYCSRQKKTAILVAERDRLVNVYGQDAVISAIPEGKIRSDLIHNGKVLEAVKHNLANSNSSINRPGESSK